MEEKEMEGSGSPKRKRFLLKSVVSVETVYDDENQNTYVVTKYMDDSFSVKIYSKNIETNRYEYVKTIEVSA